MRTISYGIPILVVGVLAALPFRRVPEEPLRDGRSEPAERTAPTALVEIDSHLNAVWTPPPAAVTPPPAAPPALPPLPSDYEHVAVPLATPPAIAQRYAAIQDPGSPPSTAWPGPSTSDSSPSSSLVQAPPPNRQAADLQASTGWETNLPLATAASPEPPPATERQDSPPSVAALKASFPQPAPASSKPTTPAPPRKRYFIREPVGR
ncbi:hypothetical protein [Roseimaritima ulvae]|uniref:Uncharacterized protein n=1 Tax=Roseimaritima ulvae TaxID=980254 RepID=A0A5B9QY25_9BACT|nr:hypothetical protein [Roseimaritima ulvae]QEG38853.1 hypothetical protein UC8_08110 [Roseimaritima ulvae]